jgi:hypothetical protein
MKTFGHAAATVAVVLVSAFCLLVQVAHVDDAFDGISQPADAVAGR